MLNDAAKEIRNNSAAKGFACSWDIVPEKLMLIVTELAEIMEVYRMKPAGQWAAWGKGIHISSLKQFEVTQEDENHFAEEVADTFIRLLDLCAGLGIDIEKAITSKVDFNLTREYRHGKAI